MITFVPNVYTPHIFASIDVEHIVDGIRSGEYIQEIATKDKKQLPAWAFNGTFAGSVINDGFIQSSGLFHFDIDDIEGQLENIRLELLMLDSLVLLFKSTSGTGLKGCIRINPNLVQSDAGFKHVFGIMQRVLAEKGITIDPACSDVRRLCFVSYDPDVYYNPNADIIDLPVYIPPPPVEHDGDVDVNMDDLVQALGAVQSDDYWTWMRVGQALKTLPDAVGWPLFNDWSKRSDKYDARKCLQKWGQLEGAKTNVRSIFNIAAAHGWKNPGRAFDTANVFGGDNDALKISTAIQGVLIAMLGQEGGQIPIDLVVIEAMIRGSIWSGSRKRLMILSKDQNLNLFDGAEAFTFLERRFGPVINKHTIDVMSVSYAESTFNATRSQQIAYAKAVHKGIESEVLKFIFENNQRETVEWRVDMFAKHPVMEIVPDKVRVILMHEPWPYVGPYDHAVIGDYKEHFPRLDEFLEFVVMSRFAADRKKFYLWMLADSDWGKGFLVNVFKQMGLLVETSVKEVEAMFEGRPCGKSPIDFKRAMILLVDEFKTIKSEIKQLQSEIQLSPKNQLQCSVEVFTKLLMSAESVSSLVGEHGVEDQFANRMSIFYEKGSIDERLMFLTLGNAKYMEHVKAYTIEFMNKRIAEMVALGKSEAQAESHRWVNNFRAKYGLATQYKRLSESIGEFVEEIRRALLSDMRYAIDVKDGVLSKPSRTIHNYIDDNCDYSERITLKKKIPDIIATLSVDKLGIHVYRTKNHGLIKGVLVT